MGVSGIYNQEKAWGKNRTRDCVSWLGWERLAIPFKEMEEASLLKVTAPAAWTGISGRRWVYIGLCRG